MWKGINLIGLLQEYRKTRKTLDSIMKCGGGESCQAEDVHDERKEISYDQLLTPGLSTFDVLCAIYGYL